MGLRQLCACFRVLPPFLFKFLWMSRGFCRFPVGIQSHTYKVYKCWNLRPHYPPLPPSHNVEYYLLPICSIQIFGNRERGATWINLIGTVDTVNAAVSICRSILRPRLWIVFYIMHFVWPEAWRWAPCPPSLDACATAAQTAGQLLRPSRRSFTQPKYFMHFDTDRALIAIL